MLALAGGRDKATNVGVGVRLCVILEQVFTVCTRRIFIYCIIRNWSKKIQRYLFCTPVRLCVVCKVQWLYFFTQGFLLIQILLFLTINDLLRNIAEMLILWRATHFQQPRKTFKFILQFYYLHYNFKLSTFLFLRLPKSPIMRKWSKLQKKIRTYLAAGEVL